MDPIDQKLNHIHTCDCLYMYVKVLCIRIILNYRSHYEFVKDSLKRIWL